MEFSTIYNAYLSTGITYLGGVNISSKVKKNLKVNGQMTFIMYLAPASQSGYNVCAGSTDECRLGCLATSGRVLMDIASNKNRIINARINKTKLFFEDNKYFMNWLFAEIKAKQKMAIKKGFEFSVRLNGTSDIDWSAFKFNGLNVFETFPDVNFYDYTKLAYKFVNKPENYHLTFSYSGYNTDKCKYLLSKGFNIAVIFNGNIPETFLGAKVIDGDITDYRIADKKGIIVGLKWKKIADKANNDKIKKSIFVVQV